MKLRCHVWPTATEIPVATEAAQWWYL